MSRPAAARCGVAITLLLLTAAPAWAIDGFDPPNTSAGHAAFTLSIFGTGFVPGERFEVLRPGSQFYAPLPATFVDPSVYSAQIPGSFFVEHGTALIREIDVDGTVYAPRQYIVNLRPTITTSSLAFGVVRQPYSTMLEVEGGTPPFQWSLRSGSLAPGLTLNPNNGVISGTPTAGGNFNFTVRVTDRAGAFHEKPIGSTVGDELRLLDDSYAVVTGRTLDVPGRGVMANDTFGGDALVETPPLHGTLTLDPLGSFRYIPNPGFMGDDGFRYRVQSAAGPFSVATARITVAGRGTPAVCELRPGNIHTFTTLRGPRTFSVTVFVYLPFTPISIIDDVPLAQASVVTSDGMVRRTDAEGKVSFSQTVEIGYRGEMSAGSEYPPGETGPTFECEGEVLIDFAPLHIAVAICVALFNQDPAIADAAIDQDPLDLFRQFRDRVLPRSSSGQDYAKLYYRFRPEFARILFLNPGLLWRIQGKVRQHRPLFEALVAGRGATLTRRELSELTALAKELEAKAGADLRKVLARLRGDLLNPQLMARHGIVIREESTVSRAADNARDAFGKLPLRFEATRDAGTYVARGPGYGAYLKPTEAVLSLDNGASQVRMKIAGARGSPQAGPEDPLAGVTNYLAGSDPTRWRTGVRGFGRIRYPGVYPGIDLVYYGNQRQLEYDFIVAPGATPSRIALQFEGVERVTTGTGGDLLLHQATGDLRLRKPVVYQESPSGRQLIAGDYVVRGRNRVGFRIGAYDTSRPLVIDPVLSYSSYLGGAGLELSMAIAVDAGGNTYVTGATTSADFTTTAGSRFSGGSQFGSDGFVIKFDPAGTNAVYATYFGGSDDDIGTGIAVDSLGHAYVTGLTRSRNFPTAQAIQPAFGGAGQNLGTDAFVFKLNPAGSGFLYSTYLGGSGDDAARGIAIDGSGNAYVAGATSSANFPRVSPLQPSHGGGGPLGGDAFIAKLNAAGTALVYATYLGGSADDAAMALAVDAAGNAYVAGVTFSSNFPVSNAVQPALAGAADAFAAKLNPAGSALVYSTFLGGSSYEYGMGIAVDAQGSAYLTGFTDSVSFPLRGAAQATFDGTSLEAFVTKLNPAGSALVYSSFLGGRGDDYGYSIQVDNAGNAYIAGETDSANFSTAGSLLTAFGGKTDGFVAKLNPAGSAFEYRYYLGGTELDGVLGVAVDGPGNVYIAGASASVDGPATFAAYQTALKGASDGWVLKLGTGTGPALLASVSAASQAGITGLAPDSIGTGYGTGLADALTIAGTGPATSLGGVTLTVRDAAGADRLAPLYFVSPGQINYVIPAGTGEGLAELTVRRGGQIAATGTARIQKIAPALFTANNSGQGVPAALALVVAPNGSRTTQPVFRCGTAPGSCVPDPIDLGADGQQVYLLLFGTGIRGYAQSVTATIGGVSVPVLGAVPQSEFPGMDQVNLGPLPRSLAGKGAVPLIVTVDGRAANTVTVNVH